MFKYRLITLDAKALMWSRKKEDCGSFCYSADLSDKRNPAAFMSVDMTDDAPLLRQLLRCLNGDPYDTQALYRALIFVDFSKVFKFLDAETAKAELKGQDAATGMIRGMTTAQHLKNLLDADCGITVTFDDGTSERFVPSDRSASMAKKCKMAYVNDRLAGKLARRLMLDLDPADLGKVQLSKYYAYRGLYLTTSERVPFAPGTLNEKTVIVIKDFIEAPTVPEGTTFFTAETTDTPGTHRFVTLNRFDGKINLYDGEGLICPGYADGINRLLKKSREDQAKITGEELPDISELTSFQVRLPFTKGMLHRVDFHAFFKENCKPGMKVTDCFGIERSISDARIILTESMFKCAGWLRNCRDAAEEASEIKKDPMKYYFREFDKYGHSLYVANLTSEDDEDNDTENLSETENYEGLNYQFLATMGLSRDELAMLVKRHTYNTDGSIIEQFRCSGPAADNKALPVKIAAAGANTLFLDDNDVDIYISDRVRSSAQNCGRGRLKTRGEHRYLSADLLALLIDIAGDALVTSSLKQQTIDPGCFYLPPGKAAGKYESETLVFLRNPHLCRNEEDMGRPLRPGKNSPYLKYGLSALTKVMMLPRASLDAMILGGADFDGDQAKIYADKSIINAVSRNIFGADGKRRLPVVLIPGEESDYSPVPAEGHIDPILVIDTFANKIGSISNMAVSFARAEYGENREEMQGKCAQCEIVTGLEIDKAKHGVSPAGDIKALESECGKLRNRKTDYYLGIKEKLFGERSFENIIDKKYAGHMFLKTGAGDGARREIRPWEELVFDLDLLTVSYAEMLSEADARCDMIKETIRSENPKRPYAFKCQAEGTDCSDQGIINRLKDLTDAYDYAVKLYDSYRYQQKMLSMVNTQAKALAVLRVKYDSLDHIPGYSEKTVGQLFDESFDLIDTSLRTVHDASNALVTLKKGYWPFLTVADAKRSLLAAALGIEDVRALPGDIWDFLCDFSCEGYYTAYYIIRDVYYKRKTELLPEELTELNMAEMPEGKRRILQGSTPAGTVSLEKNAVKIILNENIARNASDELFRNDLKAYCRKVIEELFESGDTDTDPGTEWFNKALEYLVNIEAYKKDMFWDVLPRSVILGSVYTGTEPEEGQYHAE